MPPQLISDRLKAYAKGRNIQTVIDELLDIAESKTQTVKTETPKTQIIYTQPTESDEIKALKQQLLDADKRIQILNKKIKKLSEE